MSAVLDRVDISPDFVAIPEVEDTVPLPSSAAEALPDLSPMEELNMRTRTIQMLAELQGRSLMPNDTGKHDAEAIARQMMEDPTFRPDYAKYPNETMAYLAGLVAQSNCMIVDDLAELKLYVVNKLVMEVENAKDSKARITALKALGEVDGVDAFKKRTETTISIKPIHEVEQELLTVLENVEYRVMGEENPENPVENPDFSSENSSDEAN